MFSMRLSFGLHGRVVNVGCSEKEDYSQRTHTLWEREPRRTLEGGHLMEYKEGGRAWRDQSCRDCSEPPRHSRTQKQGAAGY